MCPWSCLTAAPRSPVPHRRLIRHPGRTNMTTARAGGQRVGLDRLLIDLIRPAVVNERVYRPISWDDAEIQALARSIQEHGLLTPIVVTRDLVIISGHRRYAACRLLRMDYVPCRIEPIHSSDPGFLPLLVEANRQRV